MFIAALFIIIKRLKQPKFSQTDEWVSIQFFGHLMQTVDSLEKTLILGKTEGKRRKGAIDSEMVR